MKQITIVLVLYQKQISTLPFYPVLEQLAGSKDFTVILYDNSPASQENPLLAENIIYFHDEKNPGIAKAYNYAWKKASESNAEALLLLDDDTQLNSDYLKKLMQMSFSPEIGAVVPQIFSDSRQISPVFADRYINRNSEFPAPGVPERRVMGINSGSLIPVSVLDKIGGFNENFPLDFLDHWFFWQIHQSGYKVQVLETAITHQLSVLNYENVSPERYQSILSAEHLYYSAYDTGFLSAHKRQLSKRLIKQFLTVKKRKIWHLTLRELIKNGEKK